MAVVNNLSNELLNATLVPPVKNYGGDVGGEERFYHFKVVPTVLGDAGSDADLIKLPPGRQRLLLRPSIIAWGIFGAARVMDIGYRAYEKLDGTTEAAVLNVFDDDVDVAAAGAAAMGSDYTPEPKTFVFTSKTGVTLCATIAGGTWPIGITLEGYFKAISN